VGFAESSRPGSSAIFASDRRPEPQFVSLLRRPKATASCLGETPKELRQGDFFWLPVPESETKGFSRVLTLIFQCFEVFNGFLCRQSALVISYLLLS
jgi:hypothetical protein